MQPSWYRNWSYVISSQRIDTKSFRDFSTSCPILYVKLNLPQVFIIVRLCPLCMGESQRIIDGNRGKSNFTVKKGGKVKKKNAQFFMYINLNTYPHIISSLMELVCLGVSE